ncbi:hypothetical protein [Breznakiella homolactica]|uniref:Uncharacterized protein n=1 Tax=Breznakiella homolactica TaxID=2798577 RepID=A0A7T7XPW6_9SPIR|nr:hypothetical protein [Breznakiella homolactica]QQO10207.1 hypothetical protein JFL75_04600 [Breznakiella homolactica]
MKHSNFVMNILYAAVLPVAAAVFLFVSACGNITAPSDGTGTIQGESLTIRITGPGADSRTAIPSDAIGFTVDKYEVGLYKSTTPELIGTLATVENPGASESLTLSVREGGTSLQVIVRAYRGSTVAAIGRTSLTNADIAAGNSVTVTVSPVGEGTGSVRLGVTFPASAEITKVTADLDCGGASFTHTFGDGSTLINPQKIIVTFSSVGVGAGRLKLSFYRSGDVPAAVFSESVNVWQNAETDTWILPGMNISQSLDLSASDFYDTTVNITGLTAAFTSGGNNEITFSSEQTSYTINNPGSSQTNLFVSFALPMEGQNFTVTRGGTTQSFTYSGGRYTGTIPLTGGYNNIIITVTAPNKVSLKRYFIYFGNSDIYVSSNGSDTTGLGTSASPFKTVGKALSMVSGQRSIIPTATIHISGILNTIDEYSSSTTTPQTNIYIAGQSTYPDLTFQGGPSPGIIDGSGSGKNIMMIANGANVTMGSNLTLQNGTSSTSGGGVYIWGGSTFTMTGGVITGNEATLGNGGGVCISGAGSTFTMKGSAAIYRNQCISSSYGGAGIYVGSGASFSMSENAQIYGNTGGKFGGGVFVVDEAAFTMEGGTIGKNVSPNTSNSGGGVCVYRGSTFTMSGNALIAYNEAETNGGGVYVFSGNPDPIPCVFTMTGSARIENNKAVQYGGGVSVVSRNAKISTFTMATTNRVQNNQAASGGGVHNSSGILTGVAEGSTVINNTTPQIYIE